MGLFTAGDTDNLTKVVNIHKNGRNFINSPNYVYIGRGSKFGNPYPINSVQNRDHVLAKFQQDFDDDCLVGFSKKDLLCLRGKILGCFCKPLACHGDILAKYVNSLIV